MPVTRQQLMATLEAELAPQDYQDYGPNGLQVEGRAEVRHIVSGVTASRAFIEAGIAAGADALLVHHGLFWNGQKVTLTGWLKARVALLLAHDVSLIAYHLPLDGHATLGNNAQLARLLGFTVDARFGAQELGLLGHRADGGRFASAVALARHLEQALGRPVLSAGAAPAPISRIAWCSGGAQGFFEAAIEAGAQAFITGEVSEPQPHLARECGVPFFACGHHATERYGVQALGEFLAQRLGITHQFIDIDNPA